MSAWKHTGKRKQKKVDPLTKKKKNQKTRRINQTNLFKSVEDDQIM